MPRLKRTRNVDADARIANVEVVTAVVEIMK
jgi:hypothetical protein